MNQNEIRSTWAKVANREVNYKNVRYGMLVEVLNDNVNLN